MPPRMRAVTPRAAAVPMAARLLRRAGRRSGAGVEWGGGNWGGAEWGGAGRRGGDERGGGERGALEAVGEEAELRVFEMFKQVGAAGEDELEVGAAPAGELDHAQGGGLQAVGLADEEGDAVAPGVEHGEVADGALQGGVVGGADAGGGPGWGLRWGGGRRHLGQEAGQAEAAGCSGADADGPGARAGEVDGGFVEDGVRLGGVRQQEDVGAGCHVGEQAAEGGFRHWQLRHWRMKGAVHGVSGSLRAGL